MKNSFPLQELTVQCSVCLDMFDIFIINRRGEKSLEPTSSVGFDGPTKNWKLIHRPGHCGGKLRVFGNITEEGE